MQTPWTPEQRALAQELLTKTLEFGADLAGLAAVADLKNCPSEQTFPNIRDSVEDNAAGPITTGLPRGAVKWEDGEKTLLVFAVCHPEEMPERDWWIGNLTPPGNKLLAGISNQLKAYLEETHPEIQVFLKPYHVEKGGVYLKDCAAQAGLGCIGKNNLLVTPPYGPRVRLRAVGLSIALPSTGPSDFDPCADCSAPCRAACPRQAFDQVVCSEAEMGLSRLPGRDGSYRRRACYVEMDENVASASPEAVPGHAEPQSVVRYCRSCEFACRIGRTASPEEH